MKPVLLMEDVIPLRLAEVTLPEGHPLARQKGEVFGFAVRHPEGVVLVDTGIGTGHNQVDHAYRPRRRPLREALFEHGIVLADVIAVINTHLHFDHCGNNRLFPGVHTYVQTSEHEAAHGERHTVAEWVWFPDALYRQVEGDVDVLPGLRILATPGHTEGHQSVLVETDRGAVLIAGQAIYSAEEYRFISDTGTLPPDDPPEDPVSYLRSAQRLIGLPKARVLFSHDAAVLETGAVCGERQPH